MDIVHVGTPYTGQRDSIRKAESVVNTLRDTAKDREREVWPVFTKTSAATVKSLVSCFGREIILLACGELRRGPGGVLDGGRIEKWIEATKG